MLRLRTFGGLWIETADGSRLPNPRPRRLGLLAILAAAGNRGVTRSRLRGIFWPDADDDLARHALSQTIYALRRDLGVRAVIAEADLRLDPEAISSDTDEFREAVTRRDWSTADRVYRGPFAAGFALDDSSEFDRWLQVERADLARRAESALEALALETETAGNRHRAVEVWKRLAGMDPASARSAASYMKALAALGDRSGAIAHARSYAAHVRQELEAEPDPIVTRLADQLREVHPASPPATDEPARSPDPPATAEPASTPADRSVVETAGRATRLWSSRLVIAGITAGLLGTVAVAAAAWRLARPTPRRPVLAIGQLRDFTVPNAGGPGGVLSEMLATSVARLSDVEMIANSRILELLERGKDTLGSARTDAARRAGATEVLEGELVPAAGGQLRLDLRRIEIGRGAVRAGYSLSGTDPLALVDSVTLLLAADLRAGRPSRSLTELTSRSPTALRLYEEGLQAYYRSDPAVALQLFRGALAEDSTFAMAAYYAYRTHHDVHGRDPALEKLALRLSAGTSDRNRLIIQTSIRLAQHDPSAPFFADTLAARFPRDPEALIRAAEASVFHQLIGPRARDLFERAIAIDSAAGFNPNGPCRLCTALSGLAYHLGFADSARAAEQVIRRAMALLPSDPNPIVALAMLHFNQGRYEAGAGALARLDGIRSEHRLAGPIFLGRLMTGRLDEADAECMVHLAQEDPRTVESYRWLCAIVWRNQGRYRDAVGLVFSGRLPDGSRLRVRHQRDPVGEVVLDLEMGRVSAALDALGTIAPTRAESLPAGRYARELTWSLARRGTAAVMAREFELARRLADSAEVVGKGSLFGRDPLLHYFIRGLIAQRLNDHHTAVDFFRRSIFSWNFGYTRANLELARSLLALGRAGEAIAPLQSALRGGWDGSNLYVTRTELHELLAGAFVAVGRRDSALAHYAAVERAWRRADPPFAARYQAARDFLTRPAAVTR